MQKIYHVSSRYQSQEYFDEELKFIWRRFHIALNSIDLMLHTAVLMNNHYHALIQIEEENLNQAIQTVNDSVFHLKQPLAIKVVEVDNFKQYIYTVRYILENPVRAGIVWKAEQYGFSTINMKTYMDPMALNLQWCANGCGEMPMSSVHSIVYGLDEFFSN